MKNPNHLYLYLSKAAGAALLATGCAVPAIAADYALLMGIGNYQEARANLPGIDKDVAGARRIAQSIGVPSANIRELFNDQVSSAGVQKALRDLESTITQGDRVFVYYSGHGGQVPNSAGGARCVEGMYVYDMKLFRDIDLEASLASLASKAGQLVMFNDSCFSGGAATKSPEVPGRVAKFYASKAVADNSGYTCGDAVNMKSSARNLIASATAKGNNMVYISAAADDEVAFATRDGSSATLAWEACLKSPTTDSNGSGSLTAKELMSCAQGRLRNMGFKQTITIVGNPDLPISFAAGSGASTAGTSTADAARRSAATLEDIRQAASSSIQVDLQASRSELRIEKDPLDFTVRSSRAGYLYLLHVGPDGKTFDLLFPNDLDQNNFVQVGTVRLPRPSWRVMASGPVGDAYVMAVLSEVKKDYSKALSSKQGPFSSTTTDSDGQSKLRVEATGAGSATAIGVFGASAVLRIREVN